nr:MAG TPA: hypothetical protein [Caudoviricetes sp.]
MWILMLDDHLTQEEEYVLALHEQANNDLFSEWLSSVY